MTWPALIEAGLWLSGELEINRTLWARVRGDGPEICRGRGRNRLDPTGQAFHEQRRRLLRHFAGLLRKFERGQLCLGRTLWKLKDRSRAAT